MSGVRPGRWMTLCPNCRTIQKAGTVCSICKCPVPDCEPKPPPMENCPGCNKPRFENTQCKNCGEEP